MGVPGDPWNFFNSAAQGGGGQDPSDAMIRVGDSAQRVVAEWSDHRWVTADSPGLCSWKGPSAWCGWLPSSCASSSPVLCLGLSSYPRRHCDRWHYSGLLPQSVYPGYIYQIIPQPPSEPNHQPWSLCDQNLLKAGRNVAIVSHQVPMLQKFNHFLNVVYVADKPGLAVRWKFQFLLHA